jgi:hypothetical protein
MAHVWLLIALVLLRFPLPLMIFIYTMFFMFLAHINISYPFIALILITTHMLSFTLIFSSSRVRSRRRSCYAAHVKGDSIPFCPPFRHISRSLPLLSSSCLLTDGNNRLGHPSPDIVHHVIHDNNLSCSSSSNNEVVCDECMWAKAHQLPYSVSSSHSSSPLDLVFSDVWGPGIDSFGRKNYYVSFIDDFSKFI